MPKNGAKLWNDAVGAVRIATILYLKQGSLGAWLAAGQEWEGPGAGDRAGRWMGQDSDGTLGGIGRQKLQEP